MLGVVVHPIRGQQCPPNRVSQSGSGMAEWIGAGRCTSVFSNISNPDGQLKPADQGKRPDDEKHRFAGYRK